MKPYKANANAFLALPRIIISVFSKAYFGTWSFCIQILIIFT